MSAAPPAIDTLAVVGVGLIGASVGLAAKRFGVARRVIGVGQSRATLDAALGNGAIDEAVPALGEAAQRADLVVVCTPVEAVAERVLTAAAAARPGTLVTDAGSTKAEIVAAIEGWLTSGVEFVGGHPIAGAEKSGPAHARADLFAGRIVVLTPTPRTPPSAVARATAFWRALGAVVREMTPADHDAALARTSHVPHVAASAVAGVTPPELLGLTAGGFRDTTRIAAGSPALWAGILLSNRAAVLAGLDGLVGRLDDFRAALGRGDSAALMALLTDGKRVRDALGSGGDAERAQPGPGPGAG
jgi:prephenate dehydrogenase